MARKRAPARAARPTVRMYRQGLGDCFLVTLPRSPRPFHMLVDCGVLLGTPGAEVRMREVAADVIAATGAHVDLVIATHEHWDHVSGFVQARDEFARLEVDRVWLPWTEKRGDPLADRLRENHTRLRLALAQASVRLHLAGAPDPMLESMLGFFGAGPNSTAQALEIAAGLAGGEPRYCYPADPPFEVPDAGARIYVLGPPYDAKMIRRHSPSGAHPETYSAAAFEPTLDLEGAMPFDPMHRLPTEYASQMTFFREHYWGDDAGSKEKDQSWRAIDASWLEAAAPLALALDSATNNTSLVVAIELASGEVMLFAADAQVGNWLSWRDCKWQVGGKEIAGPDLLRRTVLYKTGHHGSHNATLREFGLELMRGLRVALLPVDEETAAARNWSQMPRPSLLRRLEEKTGGAVLRSDRPVPAALAGFVRQDPAGRLYYEVTL